MNRRGFLGTIAAALVAPKLPALPADAPVFKHKEFGYSFEVTEADLLSEFKFVSWADLNPRALGRSRGSGTLGSAVFVPTHED